MHQIVDVSSFLQTRPKETWQRPLNLLAFLNYQSTGTKEAPGLSFKRGYYDVV